MRKNQAVCRICGETIGHREPRGRLSFSSVEYEHVRDEYRPNGWAVKQKVRATTTATYCELCSKAAEAAVRRALGMEAI